MEIDFDHKDNLSDYVTVPAGTYLCRVTEVVPGTTRNGHARWGIKLVVAEGEYVGRQAAWDGLVFSEKGTARVRRVLAALGLAGAGRVRVEPDDLVGRHAFVTVKPEEFRDPVTQHVVRRNQVPYDGYLPCESPPVTTPVDTTPPADDDDEEPDFARLPF
ncbi:MAG: hypothetical protein U1F36_18805 [Planctomycetota bacterium]